MLVSHGGIGSQDTLIIVLVEFGADFLRSNCYKVKYNTPDITMVIVGIVNGIGLCGIVLKLVIEGKIAGYQTRVEFTWHFTVWY